MQPTEPSEHNYPVGLMGPVSYPPRQSSQEVIDELVEAIRLTVEYVSTYTLPPVEGWSWYDALKKHAPDVAREFEKQYEQQQARDQKEFEDARPKRLYLTGTLGEDSRPYFMVSEDGANWTRREVNKESDGYSITIYEKYYDMRVESIARPIVKEQTDE